MILKRCDRGHYYDGEIYKECPECSGAGQNPHMRAVDMYATDYADEDSVTVALPRSRRTGRESLEDDSVTMALPRTPKQPEIFGEEDGVTMALPRTPKQQPEAFGGEAGVTMALPQTPGQQPEIFGEEVTAAQPRRPVKNTPRKQGLNPVTGWLVCIQGADFGNSFTIKLGKNFIGRSPDMNIVLHGDESIAMKKHAAIYYVPKQRRFAAEPGASGRQFYINRHVVMRPVWIKQHDILTVGNCSLMFFPCCGEHFSWEEIVRKRREQNR